MATTTQDNYYYRNGMECFDWLEKCMNGCEEKYTCAQAAYVTQALQYIYRAPFKCDIEQDLTKAVKFLSRAIAIENRRKEHEYKI